MGSKLFIGAAMGGEATAQTIFSIFMTKKQNFIANLS
jgi:hypothetical protein